MHSNYIKKIIDNFDIISGILGIIFGLFIILLNYISTIRQQDIGLAIVISCTIYMLFRLKLRKVISFSQPPSLHITYLSYIVYILIYILTIVLLYDNLYYRPTSYFILITLLTGIISIEIIYYQEKSTPLPILIQIFLLAINIRAGLFYNFPSIMGYDAYTHTLLSQVITNTGFIAPFDISNKYQYYPILHILLSITNQVSNLSIKDSIFYSIGLMNVICVITFIYYIGKKIAGPIMGMMAALLSVVTYYMILTSIANITPGSLVICFMLIVLYLEINNKYDKKSYIFILFLLTIVMIITHQLSTFVVWFSLVSIYIINNLYCFIYNLNQRSSISLKYIIFFTVAMFFYWTTTNITPNASFFDVVSSGLVDVIQTGSEYSSNQLITGVEYSVDMRSILDTIILHSTYLLLPFLSIGGALLWLVSKNIQKYSYAATSAILYASIYIIPLLGIRNLLTDRWIPFLCIILLIISSNYILTLFQLANKYKVYLIFITVCIFTFLMITVPGINKDNPLVSGDTTVRTQYTYSEIAATNTIERINTDLIQTDGSFLSCYVNTGFDMSAFTYEDIHSNNLSMRIKSLVLLRKAILSEPVKVPSKLFGTEFAILVKESFFKSFDTTDYYKVYDNNNVIGYKVFH